MEKQEAWQRFVASITEDGVYEFDGMKRTVIKSSPNDNTKLIAKVIRDTARINHESFDKEESDKYVESGALVDHSRFYRKDLMESAFEACKENKVDVNMAYLVYIALTTGWNDVLDWAGEMKKKGA